VGGSGTPVVLLPETAEAYTEVFRALSERHRTFSIDPPDLESSTHRQPGYDTAIIGELLGESLRPVLGASYRLVGHDVGAWIAYAWAAQFPSCVKEPYPTGRRNTWSSCTANLSAAIRGESEDVAILLQCPTRAA
jgi:pimeloyl-ACP methyl ester carboxylesterase